MFPADFRVGPPCCYAAPAPADDWPAMYRGATRDGFGNETGILENFPPMEFETAPLWRVPIGHGLFQSVVRSLAASTSRMRISTKPARRRARSLLLMNERQAPLGPFRCRQCGPIPIGPFPRPGAGIGGRRAKRPGRGRWEKLYTNRNRGDSSVSQCVAGKLLLAGSIWRRHFQCRSFFVPPRHRRLRAIC